MNNLYEQVDPTTLKPLPKVYTSFKTTKGKEFLEYLYNVQGCVVTTEDMVRCYGYELYSKFHQKAIADLYKLNVCSFKKKIGKGNWQYYFEKSSLARLHGSLSLPALDTPVRVSYCIVAMNESTKEILGSHLIVNINQDCSHQKPHLGLSVKDELNAIIRAESIGAIHPTLIQNELPIDFVALGKIQVNDPLPKDID